MHVGTCKNNMLCEDVVLVNDGLIINWCNVVMWSLANKSAILFHSPKTAWTN